MKIDDIYEFNQWVKNTCNGIEQRVVSAIMGLSNWTLRHNVDWVSNEYNSYSIEKRKSFLPFVSAFAGWNMNIYGWESSCREYVWSRIMETYNKKNPQGGDVVLVNLWGKNHSLFVWLDGERVCIATNPKGVGVIGEFGVDEFLRFFQWNRENNLWSEVVDKKNKLNKILYDNFVNDNNQKFGK